MKLVVFACVIAFANAGFTWDSCGTKLDRLSTLKLSVAGPLTAGSKATVTASGTTNLHVPLTSGAWQVRVYEDGVPKETHTDVGDLMTALKFDDAKNTTFTMTVSYSLPAKQASGKFSANLVATDQAKSDYLCLDIKYAYASVQELVEVVTPAPAPFCMHQEDTIDHKCFEACAASTFSMKGISGASHCPAGYNTVDKTQVILQCPDGVTSLRYCPDTALNVTVETKGEEHPTTLGSAVQPIQSGERTIVQLVSSDPELSTLVAALTAAQLTDTLSGGSFTVFAPTNKAFSLLPSAVLAHLLAPANIKELQAVLELHVLPKAIQSKDLDGVEPTILKGQSLILESPGEIGYAFGVADARILFVDLEASNGVVHVIDRVMYVPPKPASTRTIVQLVSRDPELSTLVAALTAAQLTDTLSGVGSFTVFAPTNKAFSLLPSAVLAHLLAPANIKELQTLLEYHVLSRAIQSKELLPNTKQQQTQQGIRHNTLEGRPLIFQDAGVLLVNDAVATFVDLEASNGVVHVIDQVLLPTFTSDRNLMEVVASYPQLSTFTTALKAGAFTNLGQILAGNDVLQRFQPVWDGFLNQCAYGRRGKSIFHVPSRSAQCPYTVFAPTNEAFAKLPKATLERLLDPKNIGELQDILELHIVAGDAFEVQRIRATGAFTNEKSLPSFVSSLNSQLNSDTTGDAFFIDQAVANGTTLLSAGVFYESNNRPKQISSIILDNLANLGASNGIVHIIDSVLIPLAPTKTIVESLAGDAINRGATFLAALKAGLLERTLNDTATGPYTVFVPTNEAFAKLPKATLKHLLDPRNIGELQDLLEYHIVAGHDLRVGCVNQVRTCDPSRDLESFKGATLMGQKVEVTLVGEAGIDGVIMIDKSNVIAFENSAFDGTGQSNHRSSNGNRILIDQVLTKYYMPTLVRTL